MVAQVILYLVHPCRCLSDRHRAQRLHVSLVKTCTLSIYDCWIKLVAECISGYRNARLLSNPGPMDSKLLFDSPCIVRYTCSAQDNRNTSNPCIRWTVHCREQAIFAIVMTNGVTSLSTWIHFRNSNRRAQTRPAYRTPHQICSSCAAIWHISFGDRRCTRIPACQYTNTRSFAFRRRRIRQRSMGR
jgi:hypothetical protein